MKFCLSNSIDKTKPIFRNKVPSSSRNIAILVMVALLSACSTPSGISAKNALLSIEKNTPKTWQAEQIEHSSAKLVVDDWLKSFNDQSLEDMVAYALQHSHPLQAERLTVELAKKRLDVSEAADFPELSLSVNNSRRKFVSSKSTSYQTNADISIDLRYEVDLWGKLSDQQNQQRLDYAAAQANYHHSEQALVVNIAKAWFDLIQAQQLLNLYQERAENLQRNLAMIQSSYQLGLSDALDVYLTKNDVNQELGRVAQQQHIRQERSRALALLIGDYPNADKITGQSLPTINDDIALGLPAQLLTRRADVQASWLALLALDAGLAVAHKQRFPSFNLTANVSDSSNELAKLLDGSALAWSLISSISSPLFNAGRLESLEQQAKLAVEQKEQQYLQQVYQAFADVENSISERTSLKQRLSYYLKAQENAQAAEKLAFEQYLRGLVTYTAVLASQRRSFDAQTTVVQLSNQLLQNRIDIYSALGGNYLNNKKQVQQNRQGDEHLSSLSFTHRTNMEK